MFLGDHTSPDEPGYVAIVRDVLSRFHPDLRLNMISAGAPGQTAKGIGSQDLFNILNSSRPDWLVVGVGLSDALREPVLSRLLVEYRNRQEEADEAIEATFGPEYRAAQEERPVQDSGRALQPRLERLEEFASALDSALEALENAGIRCALLTTVVLGGDLFYPVNVVLKEYSKSIREVASCRERVLVDVDRAFRDVFDRAGQYKQKVALASPRGELTSQGQALVARTFLGATGLLPYPGFRSPR